MVDRNKALLQALEMELERVETGPAVRKLWKELLVGIRQSHRWYADDSWDGSTSGADAQPPPVPVGGTFVVHPGEERWLLPDAEEGAIELPNGVEVCRVDCLAASRWSDVALGGAVIHPKKEPTEVLLRELGILARCCPAMVVIDEYCGKEEVVKPRASGLFGLLRRLAEQGQCPRRLVVFTGKNVPWSQKNSANVGAGEIVAAWSNACSGLGSSAVVELTLNLVDGRRFGAIAHDRFMRFHDFGLLLGAGFSVFEGIKLAKQTSVGRTDAAGIRRIEDDLVAEESFEAVRAPYRESVGGDHTGSHEAAVAGSPAT